MNEWWRGFGKEELKGRVFLTTGRRGRYTFLRNGRVEEGSSDWTERCWGGGEGALVMAGQASIPPDMLNQVTGLSDNHVLRVKAPWASGHVP